MRASGSGSLAFWMAGIVIAGGVAFGAAWYFSRAIPPPDATAPPPAPEAPGADSDSASGTGQPTDAPQEDAEAVVEAEPEATLAAAPLPRLQELRLEPDGLAVIAGQVSPFADVILRLDGSEIARASADGTGAFATMATLQPSDAARVLTLSQLDGTGGEIASPDEMILAPARIPEPEADETGAGTDAESASPEAPVDTPTTEVLARTDAAQITAAPPTGETRSRIAAEPATTTSDAVADTVSEDTSSATDDRETPDPIEADTAPTTPGDSAITTIVAPGDTADPAPTHAARDDTTAQTDSVPPATGPPATVPPATAQTDSGLPGSGPLDSDPAPELAAVAPDTFRPAAPTSVDSTPTREADAPAVRTPPAIPQPGAAGQVAILRSNEEGVRVVRPADPQPSVMSQVALDSISYSAGGEVELQGRAQDAARQVRVYLDNRPVASLDVDASGSWRGALPQVDTGVYTLRIDEVDAEGRVTSRVETPFKREAPEVLAAATQSTTARVAAVTVQRGDTLWAISRDRYGEGILYVRVFEANRDSIRDPDLIYPGQIFTLPPE